MLAYRTLRSDRANVLPCRPDNRKVNGSEFLAVANADELAVAPAGVGGVAMAVTVAQAIHRWSRRAPPRDRRRFRSPDCPGCAKSLSTYPSTA